MTSQAAADQLAQMQESLQQMSENLQEGESLNQIADQLGECKQCLGGESGQMPGEGMEGMGSFGQGGMGEGEGTGDGMGEGQGEGARPEEKNDTGHFDSQVRGKPKQGEAVRVGDAFGPNRAGEGLQSTREAIAGASTADDDPLTQQRLPRGARDHVKEYMLRVGTGEE